VRAILAFAVILISVWVLEAARSDITISQSNIRQTPVTLYAKPDADGPTVFVAHGFAGSQQMMQGYALPLARAGYRIFAFEFIGHGRHPVPMSGDVNSVDGATRLLVEQTSNFKLHTSYFILHTSSALWPRTMSPMRYEVTQWRRTYWFVWQRLERMLAALC
jgi:pimeloyl-ACP methyl ester carboxylesterase